MVSPDPHSFEKLRPVGLLEKYSTVRHHLGFYQNVTSSAYYSCSSGEAAPLKPLVYRALAVVLDKHPALSAIPVDEDKQEQYFVRLPQVDLGSAVSFVQRKLPWDPEADSDVELNELLEKQHNTSFKARYGELPFWRLVILYLPGAREVNIESSPQASNFVASLVYHHALGDGGSGHAFHNSLLSALRLASRDPNNTEAPAVVTSPRTALLPSIESLHPLPLSTWHILKAIWGSIFPSSTTGIWTGGAIDASSPTSHLRHLVIPPSTTKKLVAACRSNGATVTSAVQTLIAATLFESLPPQWTRLHPNGAVSFRRWLDPSVVDDDSIGVWVSEYTVDYSRAALCPPAEDTNQLNEAFWAEARRTRAAIQKALDGQGRDTSIGLLKLVGNYHTFFTKKVGQPRDKSFEVSNVGILKPNSETKDEQWNIGRCVFAQSAAVAGPPLAVSLITGPDGALVLAFTWQEGIVEPSIVDAVIDGVKRKLNGLVEER